MRIIAKEGGPGGESGCAGGDCPTVYEADDGSIYIQGYSVAEDVRQQVKLPSGEDLVRISPALLEAIRTS